MQTASYSNKSITVKKIYMLCHLFLSEANGASKVSHCLRAQVHKHGTNHAI